MIELHKEYSKLSMTETEIESYANKDFVIGLMGTGLNFQIPPSQGIPAWDYVDSDNFSGNFAYVTDSTGENGRYGTHIQKRLERYPQLEHRKIGLVLGQNDDESLVVAVFGTDSFRVNSSNGMKKIERYFRNNASIKKTDTDRYPFNTILTWKNKMVNDPVPNGENHFSISTRPISNYITLDDAFDVTPLWENETSNSLAPFWQNCCYFNNELVTNSGILITLTDNANTLILGRGTETPYFFSMDTDARFGDERYDGFAGDIYSMCFDYVVKYAPRLGERLRELYLYGEDITYEDFVGDDYIFSNMGTFAFQWKPYNLILTEDENQAREYLRTGRIPSDAWIYPWDPNEFPTYSPINPDDGGDDPNGDDGDPNDKKPTIDIDDMPPETPKTTAQSLNPNNLYWLQKGQLASFFNWFWLDAGAIIDAGDLWDKIKGLYNDLASAIINVRFMPVRKEWIGGTTATNNIIVGQIECQMQDVETINRTTATVQTIGEFNIKQYLNENFIDFSPHTEISLYLPYHGYIALDNDILAECGSLVVKAVYDVTSGTMQYMIYTKKGNNSSLINSCIAKIAVDIPVTLQSKNDRDSAIFNNVMNATAGLMSAGVSLAMKNPVGVALSLGNTLGGGTQSAQLSVKGTTGESGAYFMPQRCAIFVKKSFYKLPSKYGLHIGYPCFKSYKLNSKSLKGNMCKIQKPYITFSGNLYEYNDTKKRFRPLESEIQEIYEILEKGVIL